MRRRQLFLLIGLMTGAHLSARGPLTIVAPAAPGGGWDQTARVLQQVLARIEPEGGAQVENVPGAAGTIGLARFVTAERGNPDALLVTGLVMVSAIVTNHSPVSLADTTPIARLTGEYEAIVVPSASRWQTLGELIHALKESPEKVSWGGGSAGGTDDLLVRMVAAESGVAPNRVNYIAFPGGGAALAAVLGGQVTAGVSGYGEFAAQIASGALRLLAISAPERVAGIDAPTLRESGIALDLANWRGIVAPPGLTDAERARLTARIEAAAQTADWKAILERNGWADLLLTGAPFRQFLLAEQRRIEQVLRSLDTVNRVDVERGALQLTPRTLPAITLIGLAALVGAIGVRAARERGPLIAKGHGELRRVASLAVVFFLYAFIMPRVGFVPASAALFVFAARLFDSQRATRDLAIGLALSIALFVAFTRGLGLDLPADPVSGWLAR